MVITHDNFSNLNERKRYFANQKFGTDVTIKARIEMDRSMSATEYNMLKSVAETVETNYKHDKDNEVITKIPYFTNNVTGINIFKENKYPTGNDMPITLSKILKMMIKEILKVKEEITYDIDYNRTLLHIKYPIEYDTMDDSKFLVFNSSVSYNDDFYTIAITDPVLYAMVKDCSKYFMSLTGTDDLYIMGSDIQFETYTLGSIEFDTYFITLTKALFATTLIGRNVDQLGLMDFPGYQFSLGTYSLNHAYKDSFVRIMGSHSLIHVLPFWGLVFQASFLVELVTLELAFSYQHDTFFAYYERDLSTNCFKQVSDRTENIMSIPMDVRISKNVTDLTKHAIYNSNIRIRNMLSTHFDQVKNYNKIKDRMFPKNRAGAKTKLLSLLDNVDLTTVQNVLDVGSAPGTWMEALLDIDHFSRVDGVTRNHKKDLKMYTNIMDRINQSEKSTLYYDDCIKFLTSKGNSYDLIVSDVATGHSNYLTQSLDHDQLYLELFPAMISRLNDGGIIIMKMYDMTDKMYTMLGKMSKRFRTFEIIKPNGSCPTNPEIYIKAQFYNIENDHTHTIFEDQLNLILISQITNINKLLNEGFGFPTKYNLSHINNRLEIANIEYLPYHLALCLNNLKFSEYLYPVNLTGRIFDETTLLGDKYLRIKWDVPRMPDVNTRYVTETSVGYESKGIGLQSMFILHHGFIFEDNIKKRFFIVEKGASAMFSDIYQETCITSDYSSRLPIVQYTMNDLVTTQRYRQLFPGIMDYNRLEFYIRQVSLEQYLKLQQYYHLESSNIILNQFFRESEAMRLFYTKGKGYSTISKSKNRKHVTTLDLSKIDDRQAFVNSYKKYHTMGSTLRQTFQNMFNEYSIQIWEDELLETTICTTKRSYIEHKTGQICVSQPACIQSRRQNII